MANAKRNRAQNHAADRQPAVANREIAPPRQAPETERSLTHSPYFNGPLYERMSEDLHLGGMSQRTHEGYLRAVRKLADLFPADGRNHRGVSHCKSPSQATTSKRVCPCA